MANLIPYIILGLAPSIVWLLFYLRKDAHPEPKRKILKTFFWGAAAVIPAALIEQGIGRALFASSGSLIKKILYVFLGIGLCEEGLKYLVVREKVLKDPEFNEPLDSMLYMIISALGFAALENLSFLWPLFSFPILEALTITVFRFLGATFLHALCSGTLGFFLAFSFFQTENRGELLFFGLGIATLLHGLYNFSIMEIAGGKRFIIPIIVLIGLASFVSWGFKKLWLFSKN